MLNIDKVYVAHYLPLKDRKENIDSGFDFDFTYITNEPETKYWDIDAELWNIKTSEPKRHMSQAEISLAHKHIKIYEDIIHNQYERALIFEDDVILCDNFISRFNYNLSQTPNWDFIFIGNGCNLRINQSLIKPGIIAYKKNHPATKCTDSYCVTLESIESIYEDIRYFTLPIDFELNYQLQHHNLDVYWWDPPLVEQGSQIGTYKTAIQN